ncbi:MAG: hypothetical protein CM1200mP29_16120 [Verrucomicrobiota bacterium]|nr:MAG: hypothetical protein CM1200mP29_16120 [Verrucomicrobiota bacterium]
MSWGPFARALDELKGKRAALRPVIPATLPTKKNGEGHAGAWVPTLLGTICSRRSSRHFTTPTTGSLSLKNSTTRSSLAALSFIPARCHSEMLSHWSIGDVQPEDMTGLVGRISEVIENWVFVFEKIA